MLGFYLFYQDTDSIDGEKNSELPIEKDASFSKVDDDALLKSIAPIVTSPPAINPLNQKIIPAMVPPSLDLPNKNLTSTVVPPSHDPPNPNTVTSRVPNVIQNVDDVVELSTNTFAGPGTNDESNGPQMMNQNQTKMSGAGCDDDDDDVDDEGDEDWNEEEEEE